MANEGKVLNSQRRLLRLAYTPLTVPVKGVAGDLLMKGAFLRFLGLTEEEAEVLRDRGEALPAILQLAKAQTEDEYLAGIRQLAPLSGDALAAVVGSLADTRQAELLNITRRIVDLDHVFVASTERKEHSRLEPTPVVEATPASPAPDHPLEASMIQYPSLPANRPHVETHTTAVEELQPAVQHPAMHPLVVEKLGPAVAGRFVRALEWASTHRPEEFVAMGGALTVPLAGHSQPLPIDDLVVAANIVMPAMQRRHLIAKRVTELIAKRMFDLVGLLHLERLVMTPVGVERGELLYSLPLAPRETVTLSHKEWAIREEEYTRYIQDYMENFSETGVAQTTEMAKSTETQARRQDATSANFTSISAQPVTITSSVNAAAGSVVEANSSTQESVVETKTITSKATSRTIQDHRVSFTVATVRGTEDWTSRLLRNRHADKSMMIDYFRRMRRWRNELSRYGVRLTYDIIVPHPGRRVLARYNRLREIEAQIVKGFQASLGPNSITRDNWEALVNKYKVALPFPPPDELMIEESHILNYPAEPVDHIEELTLAIPPSYELTELGFQIIAKAWPTGKRSAFVFIGKYEWFSGEITSELMMHGPEFIYPSDTGMSGRGPVKAIFMLKRISIGSIRLFGTIKPTEEALEIWKKQCWGILREVELARYKEEQDALRAERLNLQRAIDATDSLSLRRIEREHIMLASLEWLFPFLNLKAGWFDDVPATPADFDRVMGLQASVLIKLMHTAIDWDSLVVTLLPFFWERIDEKAAVFIDHPDPLHREFLRAGAARVVLPIRPGYEEEILSLFDLGHVSSMSQSHRYKAIVDEVTKANEKYLAQTHPAGATLPDGTINPAYQNDYPIDGGKLIGRWHETMPTGALDMDVTLRAVTEV